VMCILKAGPSMGPKPVTGKGIRNRTAGMRTSGPHMQKRRSLRVTLTWRRCRSHQQSTPSHFSLILLTDALTKALGE